MSLPLKLLMFVVAFSLSFILGGLLASSVNSAGVGTPYSNFFSVNTFYSEIHGTVFWYFGFLSGLTGIATTWLVLEAGRTWLLTLIRRTESGAQSVDAKPSEIV